MIFLDFCSLCGATAGPKYARSPQDRWKGDIQELSVDETTGTLVGPRRPHFPVLHRSCWIIVENMALLGRYDACWLKDFRNCLRNISPFLRRSEPEVAPELLAEELETILASPIVWPEALNNTISLPNEASTVPLRSLRSLPPELLYTVYSFLSEFTDVDNLRSVTGRDPPVAAWKSLWQKYGIWQLQSSPNKQFCAKVEHVIRKLEHRSSGHLLWPHAAAYTTVWKNCELVLKLYRRCQHGSITNHDEHQLLSVHSSESRCHNQTHRLQKFNFRASSTLTMNFVDVHNRRYLCGVEINGHAVGYKGDRSVTSEVVGWTGLRLVSDGLGFVSFQVRDLSGWQDANPMHRPHDPGLELRYCEVKWDKESSSGTLVLSLDVGSRPFASGLVKADWIVVQSQCIGYDSIHAI